MDKGKRKRKEFLDDHERKKARRDFDKSRAQTRIQIGDQFERWVNLKDLLRLSHAETAKLLLDK